MDWNYPAYYVLNEMYITPLIIYYADARLLKAINYPAYYVLNEMYITLTNYILCDHVY